MKCEALAAFVVCLLVAPQAWSAPACPSGYQPIDNGCVTDDMFAYLSCVVRMGSNRISVTTDDKSKAGSRTVVGVGVKGATPKVKLLELGGQVNVEHGRESEAAKKIDELINPGGPSECLKAVKSFGTRSASGKPRPKDTPKCPIFSEDDVLLSRILEHLANSSDTEGCVPGMRSEMVAADLLAYLYSKAQVYRSPAVRAYARCSNGSDGAPYSLARTFDSKGDKPDVQMDYAQALATLSRKQKLVDRELILDYLRTLNLPKLVIEEFDARTKSSPKE